MIFTKYFSILVDGLGLLEFCGRFLLGELVIEGCLVLSCGG